MAVFNDYWRRILGWWSSPVYAPPAGASWRATHQEVNWVAFGVRAAWTGFASALSWIAGEDQVVDNTLVMPVGAKSRRAMDYSELPEVQAGQTLILDSVTCSSDDIDLTLPVVTGSTVEVWIDTTNATAGTSYEIVFTVTLSGGGIEPRTGILEVV